MYSFLVLGLIPGTNIQISFQAWLGIMAAVVAVLPFVAAFIKPHWHKRLAELAATEHQPVHANQLHLRVQ
jgi:hypothetical protein